MSADFSSTGLPFEPFSLLRFEGRSSAQPALFLSFELAHFLLRFVSARSTAVERASRDTAQRNRFPTDCTIALKNCHDLLPPSNSGYLSTAKRNSVARPTPEPGGVYGRTSLS